MSTEPPLRALIFDFDGTLADTFEVSLKIYNQLAPEFSLREITPEDIPLVRKMTTNEFLKFTGVSTMRIPMIMAEGKRIAGPLMRRVRPIPGIPELLPELRSQYPVMGILTSNSSENVQNFLDAHGMDYFDFVGSVSKLTGKGKHLKSIMRSFGLSEDETAYIGDETRDIRAARKAGVIALAVDWGFNARGTLLAEGPDFLISDPAALLQLQRFRENATTATVAKAQQN